MIKQSIIRLTVDRKLRDCVYAEGQSGSVWLSSGSHVELHGRGKDDIGAYVYGTAAGRCVRFYDQAMYAENAYRMAGEPMPTDAEFEARIQRLQREFDR